MKSKKKIYVVHVILDTYANITKKEFDRLVKRLKEVEGVDPIITEIPHSNHIVVVLDK